MTVPARVLVVEDDAAIADAIVYSLRKDGMTAETAASLALARPLTRDAHMLILDLGLPDGSGFSLLAEVRRAPSSPRVIVLTCRDEDVDCVAALEAGADDFVTKPFSPRALLARVRAVLRRGGSPERPEVDSTVEDEVRQRGLRVDRDRRRASFDGSELALTKIEFELLDVLAEAPGRVRTRGHLVTRVWGSDYALTERTVDSHFKALRRKLDEVGGKGLVETVRGVGFRLREGPLS